jgi:hypothetical protein
LIQNFLPITQPRGGDIGVACIALALFASTRFASLPPVRSPPCDGHCQSALI